VVLVVAGDYDDGFRVFLEPPQALVKPAEGVTGAWVAAGTRLITSCRAPFCALQNPGNQL
jgi:hypothetical protein